LIVQSNKSEIRLATYDNSLVLAAPGETYQLYRQLTYENTVVRFTLSNLVAIVTVTPTRACAFEAGESLTNETLYLEDFADLLDIFSNVEIPTTREVICTPSFLPVASFSSTEFLIDGEVAEEAIDQASNK